MSKWVAGAPLHASRGGFDQLGIWHVPGDGPHEARQFPGDRASDDIGWLAGAGQLAIARAQTQLCLPGNLADRFGLPLLPEQQLTANPGPIDGADRMRRVQTRSRSELSAVSFVTLGDDLQTVRQAPTTDARLQKRIVRAVIEVVTDIGAEAGEVILFLHWMGGIHTELRLPRRRRGQRDRSSQDIVTAVRQLVLIANVELIAGILNRNKLTTGSGNRWTRERVTALRSHHKIPVYCPAEQGRAPCLNLSKAAAYLQISSKTLRVAAECGEIDALRPLAGRTLDPQPRCPRQHPRRKAGPSPGRCNWKRSQMVCGLLVFVRRWPTRLTGAAFFSA
jgi:hypothetical protein